ncbi:WAP four-disulfide core domain protein 18-like isoform X2 [Rhinatrema bivittatum]|uniref:WAP four-disulfide core domain protein 18-like isoform X2 n=1 Tax=Rhinatrema bivittatum TaxID=194408 RepID=UPI0011264F7C|nr:WAP four-disulfide core domain protein 18-like isoform X2 [Rhinatrema bivittatum]
MMKAAASISLLLALLTLLADSYPATEEHPGVCPIPKDMALGNCDERCKSDSDCAKHMKCCKTGCDGLLCQLPNDKPGLCPAAVDAELCPRVNQCISDSECQGTLKCCSSGCPKLSCQEVTQP